MPRVHVHLHDIDAIEDLEDQESWEEQIGPRHEARPARPEPANRSRGEMRLARFGASEAIERKRSDRRKTIHRSARRSS